MRLFLALILTAGTCAAQGYTHRGFVETRGTLYPQKTPTDRANTVGEALFRYEGFYNPSGPVQFAGAVDFQIDTHHQVLRDFEPSWQDREIRRPLAQIRRLSATYYKGPITFEAGKQFIRWGKADIVTPLDRFAPRDYLTVVDNDFLAITAARLSFEKGAHTLEAVWSPRLTPSRIPLPDQRWGATPAAVQPGVTIRDAGVRFPGGFQSGARWSYRGALEYEASFYQGYNHLPSFNVVGQTLTPEGGLLIDIERFYPKMIMAGGVVAYPMRFFTVKAEVAHFSSSDSRADEYALYVIQLERQAGEWFFVGGYAGESVTTEGSSAAGFAPDRGLSKTFLGRAGYTIDANRSLAVETAVRQNGDGVWVKFEYSQALGSHWRAATSTTIIGGDPGDFLGQYRRNSHLGLVVRYSF